MTKQNPYEDALHPAWDITSKEYLVEHQYTVMSALSICAKLHDKLPALEGLVEAGEKSTDGEWLQSGRTSLNMCRVYSKRGASSEHEVEIASTRGDCCIKGTNNAQFITQAANTRPILKTIVEEMKDEQ